MKYCASCGYCIEHVSQPRCPECGRRFDPSDPKTFTASAHGSRSRRRSRRLLIWVALLPVAYGLLVGAQLSWMYLRYRPGWTREQAGVKRIVALGGRVVGRYGGNLSLWDRVRCRGLDYLGDRVIGVVLSNTQVRDSDLSLLSTLPALQYLDLPHTGITDAGLRHLQNVRGLWELRLGSTSITDTGLVFLRGLPLTVLDLSDTNITDRGTEELLRLTELRYLCVKGTKVTPTGVDALKRVYPDATVIGP